MHTHIQTHVKAHTRCHCSNRVIFFPSVIISLSSVNQFSPHCQRCCPLRLNLALLPSTSSFHSARRSFLHHVKRQRHNANLLQSSLSGRISDNWSVRDHTRVPAPPDTTRRRGSVRLSSAWNFQKSISPHSLISYPLSDYGAGEQYSCQLGDIIL